MENNQATRIFSDLGVSVLENKQDFIHLLNETGIPASNKDTERELLEKFFDGIDEENIKELMLGASMLTADASSSFDSENDFNEHITSKYHCLTNYFSFESNEGYSNLKGGAVSSIADAVGNISNTVNTGMQNKGQRQNIGINMIQNKELAKQQSIQAVLDLKKAKLESASKKNDSSSKTLKYVMIGLGGAVVITAIIYFTLKASKK